MELLVGLPSLAVNDHVDVEGLMFLVEVLDADIAGADAAHMPCTIPKPVRFGLAHSRRPARRGCRASS